MKSQRRVQKPLSCELYALLHDRAFHSGSDLARRCGVSRAAVWKAISALRVLGVTVEAVPNRGYRLPDATEPLRAARIAQQLSPSVAARLRAGDCCWSTGSTNTQLLERASVPPGQFDFLTAEHQSAGRGRRTRRWLAPPGAALCLSLSWSFTALPADVGALSLAIGVCALRALQSCGYSGVRLKWPNDLVVGGAKLGGILTELRAESGGPAFAVIGIGLNIALSAQLREAVRASGTEPIDLATMSSDPASVSQQLHGRPRADTEIDRNRLAAALIGECIEGLTQFERSGVRGFLPAWRAADALAGKPVLVQIGSAVVAGHARGIDLAGAFCVQTRTGLQRFITGEVSVRTAM